MQKTLSQRRTNFGRPAIVLALILIMATAATRVPAVPVDQPDERGFGMTTGLIGIVPGQRARLTVWNKGDQPVLARIQFVDEEGKVLILCNGIIQPGKSVALEYQGFGGGVRNELQAQFGTNAKRSIGLLMPTVQIIDGTSNETGWMIGQEGFAEFRPIFNPPLVAPW